jgi:hypothetical protein
MAKNFGKIVKNWKNSEIIKFGKKLNFYNFAKILSEFGKVKNFRLILRWNFKNKFKRFFKNLYKKRLFPG